MDATVSRPSLNTNPALSSESEPVYVRLRPHFEAIRATVKHRRTLSPWLPKSAIVESVAHLAIELLERYALKEVTEAEKQKVEKHVASCRKCEFFLEEQLGWMAAMRSPFRRKVEKMIEAERKKAKR